MDSLRIILLIIGGVFIAGVYLWETRWRRRSRDLDSLDTSYLDEIGGQRSRRDFGYSRTTREESDAVEEPTGQPVRRPEHQEDLPLGDTELSATDEFDEFGDESPSAFAESVQSVTELAELDYVVPTATNDYGVSEQINRLEAFSASSAQTSIPSSAEPGLVVALTMMARPGERFAGKTLRAVLEELGFRHGRMKAFHHYGQTESGRRDPLCTVVNVVKPGTFELDSMDELTTPGLALFMQVSGREAEGARLDSLLELGARLAQRLGGDLMDETRSILTSQAINHLREKIAEFSRLQRLRR